MRIHEEFEAENGRMRIYGSNRPIKIKYAKPEWADEPLPYFMYRNHRHYLSEFLPTTDPFSQTPLGRFMRRYDGYATDSYFSGILIKWGSKDEPDDYEVVRAFTFII